jgi:ribose 5-phosphate isomerase A
MDSLGVDSVSAVEEGMNDLTAMAKKRAGQEAAHRVRDGMVVGLGTGSTTAYAIEDLGRRIRNERLSVVGIPTSYQAAQLARQSGISVRSLEDVDHIDVALDGADEVDPEKNLIKGGGAAHTQEKVVDSLADHFIVVVDDSKLVKRLGERFPVPVEVLPMAFVPVMDRLKSMGGDPVLRMAVNKVGPVVTDQGNFMIDVRFPSIENPRDLELRLNNIPGVVENGLFVGLADLIIVGVREDGTVREIK